MKILFFYEETTIPKEIENLGMKVGTRLVDSINIMIRSVNLCSLWAMHLRDSSLFCVLINHDVKFSPNNRFIKDIIVLSLIHVCSCSLTRTGALHPMRPEVVSLESLKQIPMYTSVRCHI